MTSQAAQHGDWNGWSPDWKTPSPHTRQETHSPTERVALRAGAARTVESCARRVADVRLWESLSVPQQDAAREIARGYTLLSSGLGFTLSDWERVPGTRTHNPVTGQQHAVRDYADWVKYCDLERVSHSLVVDILVFGFSCRALDRDCRAQSGMARANLGKALNLYCRMRGWPEA